MIKKLKFKLTQIKITDGRIGILSDYLKQLFEPFYRGRNVRYIPGTGLGLLIVKKFVDLHHGQIELTSEIDVDTKGVITLPQSS